MTKDTLRNTSEKRSFDCMEHGGGGADRRETASSPDPSRKPVTNKECVPAYNHVIGNLMADRIEEPSMAVSVTRHASTPYRAKINSLFSSVGHGGRQLVGFDNSLPESLPEKDERYQYVLGVVGSGRLSAHGYPPFYVFRYPSRKLSRHVNSLPIKYKQYQYILRVVEGGRECTYARGYFSLYSLSVQSVVDQNMNDVYNPSYGKSDLIKGPTKEIHNGSI